MATNEKGTWLQLVLLTWRPGESQEIRPPAKWWCQVLCQAPQPGLLTAVGSIWFGYRSGSYRSIKPGAAWEAKDPEEQTTGLSFSGWSRINQVGRGCFKQSKAAGSESWVELNRVWLLSSAAGGAGRTLPGKNFLFQVSTFSFALDPHVFVNGSGNVLDFCSSFSCCWQVSDYPPTCNGSLCRALLFPAFW